MATIIECTESHYEAQMMPYGKAYISYGEWRKSGTDTCGWSITAG
jgi:hypothetical protein